MKSTRCVTAPSAPSGVTLRVSRVTIRPFAEGAIQGLDPRPTLSILVAKAHNGGIPGFDDMHLAGRTTVIEDDVVDRVGEGDWQWSDRRGCAGRRDDERKEYDH